MIEDDKSIIPKDWIKSYIFNYIDYEIIIIKQLRRKIRYSFNFFDDDIIRVKEDANNNKIKLSREDIRMCIWVGFQRCKLVLESFIRSRICSMSRCEIFYLFLF